ncbi:hypothetical protein G6F24_016299 [Rhizopus arrhizus]|nr:hypothetical protein G6F24_016299 [Rhizopus arrhizus]
MRQRMASSNTARSPAPSAPSSGRAPGAPGDTPARSNPIDQPIAVLQRLRQITLHRRHRLSHLPRNLRARMPLHLRQQKHLAHLRLQPAQHLRHLLQRLQNQQPRFF